MTKDKIKMILKKLDKNYGRDFKCFLDYNKDYELLFATILAAQCTDKRVNETTKVLFKKYKKLEDYKNAKISELEKIIMPCGFYHSKAKNVIETASILLDKYDGKVPFEVDDLIKLKGVGRKTANVIRTQIYKLPSVVCDTHVIRISNLLGLGHTKEPKDLEYELMNVIPKSNWSRLNPQLITHGRTICKARKRECEKCFLQKECEFYNNK